MHAGSFVEFGEASRPTAPSRPAGCYLLRALLITAGPGLQPGRISQFGWQVAGKPEEEEQDGSLAMARHVCASQGHWACYRREPKFE